MQGIEVITKDRDIVYSPDDGGWYVQDYKTDQVSKIYATRREAINAAREESIVE